MRCSPTASTCRSADDRSTASARSRADAVNPLGGGFHPPPFFFVLLLRRHEAQGRRSGCIVSETAERIGRPRSDRARRSRSRCGSGLEEAGDAVGWPLNRVTGAFDDPVDLGQLRRATGSEQPFQIGVKPAHPRRSSHGAVPEALIPGRMEARSQHGGRVLARRGCVQALGPCEGRGSCRVAAGLKPAAPSMPAISTIGQPLTSPPSSSRAALAAARLDFAAAQRPLRSRCSASRRSMRAAGNSRP